MTDDKKTLEKIYRLRVACRYKQGYITFDKFPNGWFDEEDESAIHFAIYSGNSIVASARVNYYNSIEQHHLFPAFQHLQDLPKGERIGYLGKAVVLPQLQRHGLSKMLVRKREENANHEKAKHLFADMNGFQINNFINYGYMSLGLLDTSKVNWELSPFNQNLMHKKI